MPGPLVTAKIILWRDSVLAWFAANPGPTTRTQNVEAALTEGELTRLLSDMWDYREADPTFLRFPQVLFSLGQPNDRYAAFDHGFVLPWWGDCTIDEWDGPDGKGTSINFWAREGTELVPAELRVMSLKWFPGPAGENFQADTMGWAVVDEEEP